MKIFLLILFVISSGQTFLQDFHNWVQDNSDLLDGFVEDSKNPIDAFQLQQVQLNGKQFISLTNGWLSQETFDSSYTKQYFTIITSKLAILAVDVRENIKFVIDKEQSNPQIVMFEQENYRGMNIKTNSQNRLVIYPRVNEVVSQKQQDNNQIIEFSNIEQEQFLIYILYGAETELRDAQNLFNFITEFIELIESQQPPKYKQCKPKNANKKKSTKQGSKQSQKKPQEGGKATQSRGSLKDKDNNEKQKQSSLKDHSQQQGDDFNKKMENLDDSGLNQNQQQSNDNDLLRDKDKGKRDNESGTGVGDDGLGAEGQNGNKTGDAMNDNDGNDNKNGKGEGENVGGKKDGQGDGSTSEESNNNRGDDGLNNENGDKDRSDTGNKDGQGDDGLSNENGNKDGQDGGNKDGGNKDGQDGGNKDGQGDGADREGVDNGTDSNKGDDSEYGTDKQLGQGQDGNSEGVDGLDNNQKNKDQGSENDNDNVDQNKDQNKDDNNDNQNLGDDKNQKCVNLYSECYFSGDSIELCGSHAEITDKLQNFKIKSIEMDDGIEVSFFGESHFENQVITITDDIECLDIPIILSPTDIEELIQILK